MGKKKRTVVNKRREIEKLASLVKKKRRIPLTQLAEVLRWKTPASERWFQKKWKSISMLHQYDLFNRPFGPFIPDCINTHFKYIIEIDGAVHGCERVKKMDELKEVFFKDRGFSVFRIKSYDANGFEKTVRYVRELREKEE